MIKDGVGGANTRTGLQFEAKADLRQLFTAIPGYELRETADNAGYEVWFAGKLLAHCFKKHEFYRFLKRYQINWQDHLSKRLEPDNGLFVIVRDTLFIIEIKYQKFPAPLTRNCKPAISSASTTQNWYTHSAGGWNTLMSSMTDFKKRCTATR